MQNHTLFSRARFFFSWYLDIYQWEHRVVRARNYLSFRLQPKDHPSKQKVFVVGYPRSGNHSLHVLFKKNNLNSCQTPGIWKTKQYDCFSDRGNFWPFWLMDKYYPNSIFILNTRPVYKYIRSVINHRFGRGKKSSGWFEPSTRNIQNEIIERNLDMLNFVKQCKEKNNCLVVNIERPGSFDFVCNYLRIQMVDDLENKPKVSWRDKDLEKIEKAFHALGIEDQKEEPFLLDPLISDKDRTVKEEFLRNNQERIFL